MRENKTSKTEATAEIGEAGVTRRGALECMVWAGTGVLWTVSGGVPKSLGLLEEVLAAEAPSFTFLQISDSHIGFNKSANPDALGTLREAIAKVKAVPAKPAFMIHTGDITHLSRPDEFDNANAHQRGRTRRALRPRRARLRRLGHGQGLSRSLRQGHKGSGWYSFDDHERRVPLERSRYERCLHPNLPDGRHH